MKPSFWKRLGLALRAAWHIHRRGSVPAACCWSASLARIEEAPAPPARVRLAPELARRLQLADEHKSRTSVVR